MFKDLAELQALVGVPAHQRLDQVGGFRREVARDLVGARQHSVQRVLHPARVERRPADQEGVEHATEAPYVRF